MQKLLCLSLLLCGLQALGQDTTRPAKTLKIITITGSRPPIERKLDKTVVNFDRHPVADGSTVLEAMQHLPGVQVTPEGQVSINGKSGVTVYIDGKQTWLSATDLAALLSGMPASSVQRIEIMTNPPARYDASGTSGIINIVKKKNQLKGFNGNITASFVQGRYPRYTGGISGSYRNEQFNIFLSNTVVYTKTLFGRDVTSDFQDIPGNLLSEQVSANRTIGRRFTYRPTVGIDWYITPRSTLSLSGTTAFSTEKDSTLSQLEYRNSRLIPTAHEDFTSYTHDQPYNYTTTLQWTRQLDTLGRSLTVDWDYSSFANHPTRMNRNNLFDTSHAFLGETDALLLQHRHLRIYSVKADYSHPFPNGRWEAGVKSSYVRTNNDNSYYHQLTGDGPLDTTQSDYSINTEQINAAYLSWQRTGKHLEAQAGLRAEQSTTIGRDAWKGDTVTQRYFQVFPTLFLGYKPNDNNTLLIRLGRRIERPDYSELIPFRLPLTPTLYFQGNPNLRPHLAWHGELGYSWKNTWFITLGGDLDHDYAQTIPYIDPGDTTLTRRPTNVQAHSWNLDLTWSKQLMSFWSTDNTVSFYQNGFNRNSSGYWLTAPGIVSVYVSSNNTLKLAKDWTAEISGQYNSRRRLITSGFGPTSMVDIAVKRSMWKGKGSITINGHNILQDESHNVIDKYVGLYQYSYLHYYTRSVSLTVVYRLGTGKLIRNSAHTSSEDEQRRAGN